MATGVKIVGDVSEIQCAERCWLLDVSWRMSRVHRKWERMAPALHYLSPSRWEKSTPVARRKSSVFKHRLLLLCLGCYSYSCARRDAQVKAHLCYRGAVNTSASLLTEVMHILLNDSQVLVIAEVTHMSCMSVNVCGCTLFNFEFLILISKQ